MVLFLARHEWRVLSASAVTRLVVGAFAVALAGAAVLGGLRAVREQREVQAFEQRAARQRAEPPSLRADALANEVGWLALLPSSPLVSLAVGQSDVYPDYLKVTARSLDALVSGDQIEHPLAVASGQFDVAFVVLFLYPLLIFAVSFDLTATERDGGTLRMVLSQPIRLRDVVAGKLLARSVLLAAPVMAIPLLVLPIAGAQPGVAVRLLVWTAAVAAYGAIWHGLAVMVNARGQSAAANALVLAGIWLVFAVVGPSTINLFIAWRYPMPSRVEAAVQARAATQAATVQGSRELGQFLQDHPTSANVGRDGMRQFALLQAARDRQVAERLAAVEAAFDGQLRRQQQLAGWLSALSPTMVAQGVLLDAAGTGTHAFDRFRAEAGAFQLKWRAYFEPRVLDAATLTAAEYASAPDFVYAPERTADVVRRTVTPIGFMAAVGAALVWLGFRQYRGYTL